MKDFSCSNCGAKVSKIEGKGQIFSYGEFGKIRLTQKCKIIQCEGCREIYETKTDTDRLGQALENSLTDNVIEILEVIRTKHNLRKTDVAMVCGVTPATLSRFKNNSDGGKKIPSEKFLILKRIAARGQAFIEEMLNETWEIQVDRSSSAHRESAYKRQVIAPVVYSEKILITPSFQTFPSTEPTLYQMKRKI